MKKNLFVSMALLSALCFVSCATKSEEPNVNEKKMEVSKEWKAISPKDVDLNAVSMFGDAMALAVGNADEHNAMAIAWGGFGVLYNRPVVTVYVSSSRYTYEFMEKNDYFTVMAFPEDHLEKVMYIGRHSGRDSEDKIADAGLTTEYTPLGNLRFAESNLCFECKLIYKEVLIKNNLDAEVAKFYDSGTGMHSMYIGEVVNVWRR